MKKFSLAVILSTACITNACSLNEPFLNFIQGANREELEHIQQIKKEKHPAASQLSKHYFDGDFVLAASYLRQWETSNPNDHFVLRELGWSYLQGVEQKEAFGQNRPVFECLAAGNELEQARHYLALAKPRSESISEIIFISEWQEQVVNRQDNYRNCHQENMPQPSLILPEMK